MPVADTLDAPLLIEVISESGKVEYCEETASATLDALRNDILEGKLRRDAATVIDTRSCGELLTSKEGTLQRCAMRYPQLIDLYTPIRRHAISGMKYGILAGVLINLICFSIYVVQFCLHSNYFGASFVVALPVFLVSGGALVMRKNPLLQILGWLLTLAGVGSLILLFSSQPFILGMFVGAVLGGFVFYSMPGMAIGAIIGTVRRPDIERARDAPDERPWLLIGIPLAIAAVLITLLVTAILLAGDKGVALLTP